MVTGEFEATSVRDLKYGKNVEIWRAFSLAPPPLVPLRRFVESVVGQCSIGFDADFPLLHPCFKATNDAPNSGWNDNARFGFAQKLENVRKDEYKRKGEAWPIPGSEEYDAALMEYMIKLFEAFTRHKTAVNNAIASNETKRWQELILVTLDSRSGTPVIDLLKRVVKNEDGSYNKAATLATLALLLSFVAMDWAQSSLTDWTLLGLGLLVVGKSAHKAWKEDGDISTALKSPISDEQRGTLLLYSVTWLAVAFPCAVGALIVMDRQEGPRDLTLRSLGFAALKRVTEYASLVDLTLKTLVRVAEVVWCASARPLIEALAAALKRAVMELHAVLHEALARAFAHTPATVQGLGLPFLDDEALLSRKQAQRHVLVDALFRCTVGQCKGPRSQEPLLDEHPVSLHDKAALFRACDGLTLGALPNLFGAGVSDAERGVGALDKCRTILSTRTAAAADTVMSVLLSLAIMSVVWRLSRSWKIETLISTLGSGWSKVVSCYRNHRKATVVSLILFLAITLSRGNVFDGCDSHPECGAVEDVARALTKAILRAPHVLVVLWLLGAALPLLATRAMLAVFSVKKLEEIGKLNSTRYAAIVSLLCIALCVHAALLFMGQGGSSWDRLLL